MAGDKELIRFSNECQRAAELAGGRRMIMVSILVTDR